MIMTGEDNIKKWIDDNLCIEEFLLAADVNEDDNSEIKKDLKIEFSNKEVKDYYGICSAEFVTQPPSNLRKSNFFNFTIKLLDRNLQPVNVESCSFLAFCDDESKNGVKYSINSILPDQTRVQQKLLVRLVESETKVLVRYDTNSRKVESPEMQRVLVTHKAICSRCIEDKTCGHKMETPSNPIITSPGQLKFFLKCNQNCVKGPGKPSSSRRFQLLISMTEELDVLCISQPIFVHNNSKHTKAKSQKNDKPEREDPKTFPKIHAISPSEGWTMGGQTIIIVGDNFYQGLQVIFGSIPVISQFITSHAIRVQSPPGLSPGPVQLTLALGQHHYCLETPATFTYISPNQPNLEYGFSRLARVVPRYPGDPLRLDKELVLERAAEQAEAFYSLPVGRMVKLEVVGDGDLMRPWPNSSEDKNTI